MSKLSGSTDLDKLKCLCNKTYGAQAKWFLNAWWSNAPLNIGANKSKVEQVWVFTKAMEELDSSGSAGSSLEQFTAHRFLEKNASALTWTSFKKALDKLKQNGIRILGDETPKRGAHNKPVIFLHPKDFYGTLIELEQE